jgi:Dyp-type peroxidase family
MSTPQLPDIQAFIMHTYRPCALRTFVLKVQNAQAARRFLGGLVSGDASAPQLATADQWQQEHTYRVNVGITYNGLAALEVPEASLGTFPDEFVGGSVAAAPRIGDTGDSAPEKWQAPFASPDIHVLVFLFLTDKANTEKTIETVSARLRALYGSTEACQELSVRDARSLPGDIAHFGYRDGFAQPTIEGGPPPVIPDILPQAAAREFLLGYENRTTDRVPAPLELCRNGSYAAFRILEQDCHAFETFLADQSKQTNLDPELIAAKLCGRWRSGAPLSLFPNADDPQRDDPRSFVRYNSFDYVKNDNIKPSDDYDDSRGTRCPIGSHIRRMNPRHSEVAGSGLSRRIVRRGLPYGPPYDAANPKDGIERGLLGLFIGASLRDQFEFLMKHWANDGGFAGGLGQTKDPIIGDNSPADSKFLIPVEGSKKPVALRGFPRLVTTRGGAYCFLPSVTAIKYLAALR